MATLITRETAGFGATAKNSPLSNAEIDNNFINLNTDIDTRITNIPTGVSVRPSLLLDFANEKVLDPRIVYTRDSTGTYYGNTTVKGDENTCLYSSTMGNVASKAVLTAETAAPDGTMTAYKTVTGQSVQLTCYSIGGGSTYSIYAKPAGSNYLCFKNPTNSTGLVYFDLINNKCSNNLGFILDAGNGWKRCVYRHVTTYTAFLPVHNDSFSEILQGTGLVYLWGPQVENRLQLTEYVPTGASAVSKGFFPLLTASANIARFDNDPVTGDAKGLLVEEVRTNLLSATDKFDSIYWTKSFSNAKSNVTVAPDGSYTAYKLAEDTTNNYHLLSQNYIITANTQSTFSCYIKPGERRYSGLQVIYSTNYIRAVFDFDNVSYTTIASGTGAAVNNASIISVGNGWYRCSITGIVSTTATTVTATLFTMPTATYGINQGDGYSGIYVWGPQAEAGYMATSYIPSTFVYNGRASTGTSTVNGVLVQTPTGQLRYNESNMLLEGSNTSLLTYTENFDKWTKSNVEVLDNNIADPFDTQKASKIFETAANATHFIKQTFTGTVAGYNGSIYLKAGERTWALVELFDGTSVVGSCYFNLGTGVVGTGSGTISALGNSWYRCNISGTLAVASCELRVYTATADNTNTFTGTVGSGIYAFGAQVEVGSLSSYFPSKETFDSRASVGTYFDKSSTTLAETNIITWNSQVFSNWTTLTAVTVADNDGTVPAPDGTSSAAKLLETVTSSTHTASRAFTYTNTTTYTWSIFAKANGRDVLVMNPRSAASDLYCYFTLSGDGQTFSVPANHTGTCTLIKDGWYRCSVTGTTAGTAGRFEYGTTNTYGSMAAYAGDITKGIYVWGAQLELRNFMGAYTPRVSAVVNNYVPRMFTMSANLPRIDHDANTRATKGLLLEPESTNLLLHSETFTGWTANCGLGLGTVAPDGMALKLISSSSTTTQSVACVVDKVASIKTYTGSVYIKHAEHAYCTARYGDNTNNVLVTLNNGVITSSSNGTFSLLRTSLQTIGNGWYRLISSFATDTGVTVGVSYYTSPTSTISYTGDNYSGQYVWGAQLEEGLVATSYIKTTTVSVTRAADVSTSVAQNRAADVYTSNVGTRQADLLSITGNDFSSWYRQDEGSFYTEASKWNSTVSGTIFAINSGTTPFSGTEYIRGIFDNSSYSLVYQVTNNSVITGSFTLANAYNLNIFTKAAVALKQNDGAFIATNLTTVTDTAFEMPKVSKMDLGMFNGHIKKLAYYPARLSNTELQYLVQ